MLSDLLTASVLVGIAHSGIRLATPYLFAAIGETISQRAGVLNLGVDGIMLMGAFSGFYVVFQGGDPWLGVATALLVGAVLGLLMAVVSVTMQAEQGISGIGLYLFGLGLSSLLARTMIGSVQSVSGFSARPVPVLSDIPVLGEIFFDHSVLVYLAYLLVPLAWFVIQKTPFGLSIRAVGHNPEAADSLGIHVDRVRYLAVIIGSALAGVGGASLSIGLLNVFREGMTNGIGFIAVALVYFGGWRPVGVLGGALLFSTVNALQLWVQALDIPLPSDLAVMLPYVLTIFALAFAVRGVRQPAALAKPYERGE